MILTEPLAIGHVSVARVMGRIDCRKCGYHSADELLGTGRPYEDRPRPVTIDFVSTNGPFELRSRHLASFSESTSISRVSSAVPARASTAFWRSCVGSAKCRRQFIQFRSVACGTRQGMLQAICDCFELRRILVLCTNRFTADVDRDTSVFASRG